MSNRKYTKITEDETGLPKVTVGNVLRFLLASAIELFRKPLYVIFYFRSIRFVTRSAVLFNEGDYEKAAHHYDTFAKRLLKISKRYPRKVAHFDFILLYRIECYRRLKDSERETAAIDSRNEFAANVGLEKLEGRALNRRLKATISRK